MLHGMLNSPSVAVAAELRGIAARRDVSQAAIAEALGVTKVWVSRRFRGHVALDVNDVARICEVLEVRPADVYAAADTTPEAANQ